MQAVRAQAGAYRCQSAYKLAELDTKFNIFQRSRCGTALDLAAAPGGFAQVALERMRSAGATTPLVIGVDLRPIDPLPGLVTVRGNILHHHDVLRQVRLTVAPSSSVAPRSIKAVLHDGVSVVQGQRALSVTYSQNQMTLSALQLACAVFHDFGTPLPLERNAPSFFVTKVMRSRHLPQVLRAGKACFHHVETHRPQACKPDSPETYLVMWGRRPWKHAKQHNKASPHDSAVFSLPPFPEDAASRTDEVVWFCLGCGQNRIGCRACPACSRPRR